MESNKSHVSCEECGGCSHCGSCDGCGNVPSLNERELALMKELNNCLWLPMCRFVLVPKGCYPDEGTVILSPVLLESEEDSLETVVERGDTLVSLARRRFITLDFDIPLNNCTYELYYRSALFREFSAGFQAHPDGKPVLQRGSIAITGAGQALMEAL